MLGEVTFASRRRLRRAASSHSALACASTASYLATLQSVCNSRSVEETLLGRVLAGNSPSSAHACNGSSSVGCM